MMHHGFKYLDLMKKLFFIFGFSLVVVSSEARALNNFSEYSTEYTIELVENISVDFTWPSQFDNEELNKKSISQYLYILIYIQSRGHFYTTLCNILIKNQSFVYSNIKVTLLNQLLSPNQKKIPTPIPTFS